jgi:CSLREA domain-containing protein
MYSRSSGLLRRAWRPAFGRKKRSRLGALALTLLALAAFQLPRSLATCPPNCGLAFTVNTTFDATTGADDATPGNGICETAPGNGVCTLRAAIEEANAYSPAHGGVSDGIFFDIPTSDPNYNGIFWTINLSSVLPNLSTSLDIIGPGADKLTVKPNTSLNFRLFNVTATGVVTLSGMTITKATPSAGDGGAIANASATVNVSNCIISASSGKHGGGIANGTFTGNGTVNLTNCILSGNSAWGGGGGGIDNGGTVNLTNCTISGNSAPINGGGIHNGGTLNLTNSTISGNTATLGTHDNGGGISNEGGTANVTNCTITGNTASNLGGGIYSTSLTTNIKSSIIALNTAGTGPDLDGSFVAQGFNLIGKNDGAAASFPAGNPNMNNDIVGTVASPIDPKLDPSGLQNNGGPTLTIALLAGSPAIDRGTSVGSTGILTTDQRGPGYTRTVNDSSVANAAGGDGTDIGAFEFGVTIHLVSIARSGNDIVVTVQAIQGATYRLERKADIANPNSPWIAVNDLTAVGNGPAPIPDPGAVSLGKAFYRVRLL